MLGKQTLTACLLVFTVNDNIITEQFWLSDYQERICLLCARWYMLDSYYVCTKKNWRFNSDACKEKLAFAAFFHSGNISKLSENIFAIVQLKQASTSAEYSVLLKILANC